MFPEALFAVAKTWKQPRHPSGDKQTVVHPDQRILLGNTLLIHATVWMNLKEITLIGEKKKKPVPKGYTLHDSIYITFLEWQNFRTGEESGSGQELGTGMEGTGGRWVWLTIRKEKTGGTLWWLNYICICGGDTWTYRVIKLHRAKHTHTSEISKIWNTYHPRILQGKTTGEKWVKDKWDLSIS